MERPAVVDVVALLTDKEDSVEERFGAEVRFDDGNRRTLVHTQGWSRAALDA